jgi:hypothetical protein
VTVDGADPGELRGFDPAARRAVSLAEEEARELGHDRVGTEHLLLGLLTNESSTARVLANAGVTLTAARHKVAEAVGAPPDGEVPPGPLPRTPRVERALGRSVRFAHGRGSDLVASQHVLLGVLDVEGTAGQVLRGLGLDVDRLRRTLDRLAPSPADHDEASSADGASPEELPPTAPDAAGAAGAAAEKPPGPEPAAEATVEPVEAAAAPEPPTDPEPVGPPPITCGGCGAALTPDGLAFRVMKARNDQGRLRDAIVFACARCGRALGAR